MASLATAPSVYAGTNTAVDITLFVVEFVVMLAMIGLGAWVGGLGIGFFGALGVAIYGFGFQMKPGDIAFDVIQLIIAAICCIAAVQAAGGLDYIVHLMDKALRRFPVVLTFVATLITFAMTVVSGTGHTAYALLPLVVEVAKDNGLRPSRPLTSAVVASQMAICASPVSAAVIYVTGYLEGKAGPSYVKVLSVTIPANLIGCLLTALVCCFLGKSLYKDKEFLRRVADGRCKLRLPLPPHVEAQVQAIRNDQTGRNVPNYEHNVSSQKENVWTPDFDDSDFGDDEPQKLASATELDHHTSPSDFGWKPKVSVVLFLIGLVIVMVYAVLISDNIRVFTPVVSRDVAIVSILLTMAGLIVVICRLDIKAVANTSIFIAGMVGIVCVLGVAWMADTFVKWWMPQIKEHLGDVLQKQTWTFAIVLAVGGALMYSQGATVKVLVPMAFEAGVGFRGIVAGFSAVSTHFLLPTYPTMIAACLMDDTGTTKTGRWIFDHSFLIPQLLAIVLTTGAAFGLAYAYL